MANNENKPPNIICYSEFDLKSCMQNGSTIGIDRAFNLGACCYMYGVSKSKTFGEGAGCLSSSSGALFCTGVALKQHIAHFLSNTRASLGFYIDCEKIIFGTDEETALINAIKTTFPNSEHILCIRHIQENAHRNILKQNVPEKKTPRNSFVQKFLFQKQAFF